MLVVPLGEQENFTVELVSAHRHEEPAGTLILDGADGSLNNSNAAVPAYGPHSVVA